MLLSYRSDALRIALEAKRATGRAGSASSTVRASGDGWSLLDVVCSAGPADRPFEERHSHTSISFVGEGSFCYRSASGHAVLAPGSVLLGNAGACFQCTHEHADGDRCLSFHFDPGLVEEIAANVVGCRAPVFDQPSLPPLRELSRLCTRSKAALHDTCASVEVLAFEVAAAILEATRGSVRSNRRSTPRDVRRVVETVRYLEAHYEQKISLGNLAGSVNLTRAHFLRLFKAAVGTTPHQFVLRLRLRAAAQLLIDDAASVTTVAYQVGFQDLSNFTRSFTAEFGCAPSRYRSMNRVP